MNRQERRALRSIDGGLAGNDGNSKHIRTYERICTAIQVAKTMEGISEEEAVGIVLRIAAARAAKLDQGDAIQFGDAAAAIFDAELAKLQNPG